MAIHIHNTKQCKLIHSKQSKIQSVPFKVLADCDAKVADYFETSVKEQENGTLKASYRGHPLWGTTLEVPQGYQGIVLHESVGPVCEKSERKFHVVNNFKSLIYWNWDRATSKNDKIVQALEWIDVAEALHSPIIEE